jgi:tetratricopeptide (TPR) repeat protein
MAEGLVGGIIGGDDERVETEAPGAVAGAEAFASAVAAKLSGNDPGVAKDTSAFLKQQTELLKVQKHHLEAEHAARLQFLQGQAREIGIRRMSLRLRVGFQIFTVLVATVIGLVGALMIRNAINAKGVVIEAFQVPPDLAQRGLTGQVIAKQVLDQLSDMQSRTASRSARPADSYTASWGNDLKVEVPATGVSFGELNRFLRDSFGHETHISGEIYSTPTGVSVTARTGDEAGFSFVGKPEELDKLVRRAAESIYEQTEPYRYANFLWYGGRHAEMLPIIKRLLHDPSPVERAWANVVLGTESYFEGDDLETYAAKERVALQELPGLLRAIDVLVWAESLLGHDAKAVEVADQCINANRESAATVASAYRAVIVASCRARKSFAEGDYAAARRIVVSLSDRDQARVALNGFPWRLPTALALHDLDAELNEDWDASLSRLSGVPGAKRLINYFRELSIGRVALERSDPHAVELLAATCSAEDNMERPKSHDHVLRTCYPWLAFAKARFGDSRGGQALIAETPFDCYACVDIRGRIAALMGNVAESEQSFTKAIELAPKLPQAYIDRGQARLDRGETRAALADAEHAATLSPRDGDAWKLWGDVLVKVGSTEAARAKYDTALEFAPNWQQLREARRAVAGQKP